MRPSPACGGSILRSPLPIHDLPRIVAFRDIFIHGYASVDDRLVRGVVEHDLAGLREAIARLLDEAGEGP